MTSPAYENAVVCVAIEEEFMKWLWNTRLSEEFAEIYLSDNVPFAGSSTTQTLWHCTLAFSVALESSTLVGPLVTTLHHPTGTSSLWLELGLLAGFG